MYYEWKPFNLTSASSNTKNKLAQIKTKINSNRIKPKVPSITRFQSSKTLTNSTQSSRNLDELLKAVSQFNPQKRSQVSELLSLSSADVAPSSRNSFQKNAAATKAKSQENTTLFQSKSQSSAAVTNSPATNSSQQSSAATKAISQEKTTLPQFKSQSNEAVATSVIRSSNQQSANSKVLKNKNNT
jgi:hypothetical protein